jgi:hypothetical protein
MTQRSILAGVAPTVIIKAGGSVIVRGHDSQQVSAETTSRWGLKVEGRSRSEIARARAAVGEHVLFDLRLKLPDLEGKRASAEVIEVQFGGSGEVLVPFASNLKVYAGKNIDVQAIRGQVDAYSGYKMSLQGVYRLGHASAGGSMDVDCQTFLGDRVEFNAGGDLRFLVRDLTSAHIRVRDIGGFWEARIGAGDKSVTLKSGGDVTIVTDQKVEPLPPDYILGKVEKPSVEE